MIKKLLSIALISTAMLANAQSFTATYDFTLCSTTSGTLDPSPVPTAVGLTFGSFSAVGTPSANPNAGGRFSFVGWPTGSTTTVDTYSTMTGSISPVEYYEVTLTPQSGYTVALNSCSFTVQRSGTGIRSYVVRTSADAYTNNLPAITTGTNLSVVATNEFFWNFDALTSAQVGSTINFGGATFSNATAFRFYGWNSESSGGTFSIDNVIFDGSISVATSIATLSFDLNANFNVYPVPNNDGIVYIENKNAQELSSIEVVDMFENVILSNKNETASKIKLNLANVSNGNYVVRINTVNGTTTKKLVIVK